jgi:hypothetical protein
MLIGLIAISSFDKLLPGIPVLILKIAVSAFSQSKISKKMDADADIFKC